VVDRDLARRKLAALDDYLSQLEEFAGTSAEAYGADWRIQRVIERTLVHDYTRLDPAIVLRVLHHDLAGVRRFRDAIAALVGA